MPRLKDRRTFDDATLARLRARAQHVIVVMFENRSFDQVLGLLDHPDRARFESHFAKIGCCPNRNDWASGAPLVTVADTGDYTLALDPPHGHQSATEQINFVDDVPQMNGFVNAYARKLSGKEPEHPKRWWVIGPVVALLVAFCGFALADIARLVVSDPKQWPLFLALVIVAIVSLAYSAWTVPSLSRWKLFAGVIVAGILVAAFADGLLHMADVLNRWPVVLIGAVSTLLVGAAFLWRWNRHQPKKPAPMTDIAAGVVAPTIMACLRSDKIPVLEFLATNYVTCVQWHSSVPGATWPNRNFVHAATSDESTDIEVGFYRDRTIFELLDQEQKKLSGVDKERTPWRIFFHDTPQVIAFRRLWRRDRWHRWHSAEGLLGAIDSGLLPTYSFVEPCHNAANGSLTNSQHPGNNQYTGDDFLRAEELMRQIYTRLTLNPDVFKKTVLLITYDEHGGIHDHWKPPKAVPPESGLAKFRARRFTRRLITWLVNFGNSYGFGRLGMRVPTVIVSPWVPSGIDDTVYDHASIVASLRRLWAPAQRALSDRDKAAYDIWDLLADPNATARIVPPPAHWTNPGAFASPIGRDLVASDPPPIRPPSDAKHQPNMFGMQLAKLDRAVARRLPPPPPSDGHESVAPDRQSGIVKLREWGDSVRGGNPSPEPFNRSVDRQDGLDA
jgi:hypothetical protein